MRQAAGEGAALLYSHSGLAADRDSPGASGWATQLVLWAGQFPRRPAARLCRCRLGCCFYQVKNTSPHVLSRRMVIFTMSIGLQAGFARCRGSQWRLSRRRPGGDGRGGGAHAGAGDAQGG